MKNVIPKEFFIQYAEGLISGNGYIGRHILTADQVKEIEKKVGEAMLEYSKGLNPYPEKGQKKYSLGAMGIVLAVLDLCEGNQSKTEELTGVSRRVIGEWRKQESSKISSVDVNWESVNSNKEFVKKLVRHTLIEKCSISKVNSKHNVEFQLEISIPVNEKTRGLKYQVITL